MSNLPYEQTPDPHGPDGHLTRCALAVLIAVALLTSRAAIVCQLGWLVLAAGNASLAQESEQGRPTLPGTIYVQASWQTDQNDKPASRSSTIALDPNTGKLVDLGIAGHSPRVSPDGKRIAMSLRGAKVDESKVRKLETKGT